MSIFHDASSEEWRHVLGYEGLYMVSSFGRVRSLDRVSTFASGKAGGGFVTRTRKGKIRPLQGNKKNKYLMVELTAHDGSRKGRTVHSLICEAWHGKRPKNAQVSHLNGNAGDNRPENLQWETPAQNNSRKLEHGTAQRGENHPMAILNEDSIAAIFVLFENGFERKQIARAFGVSKDCINDILAGRSWRHVEIRRAA